jgi:hypothetical protein
MEQERKYHVKQNYIEKSHIRSEGLSEFPNHCFDYREPISPELFSRFF